MLDFSITEELNEEFIDPPIICILGDRGSGKTLFMTGLSYLYEKVDNIKIFANYHLKEIPYEYIKFEDIADLPERLRDSVVLLDEVHIGADAYEVFRKRVKGLTKFSTQLRKLNCTLIISTQRFSTVAKRLRNMTNYIIETEKTQQKGVVHCSVFEKATDEFIKEFIYDGRQFYEMYDTNEIIELDE